MREIIVYRSSVSGVFKDKPEEMGFNAIYLAESTDAAVVAAARFLQSRCEVFDLIPGCIKVCRQTISEIGVDGNIQGRNGWDFFEWKCDTSPHSIDALLSSLDARKAHGSL